MSKLKSFSEKDLRAELRRREVEKNMEKAKGNEPVLPIEVTVYAYGSKEGNWETFKEEDGDYCFSDDFIDSHDLQYLGMEVALTYRIENAKKAKLIKVDNKELKE